MPDEQLVKDGPANCQHEDDIVGGQLFCTSQRLIFEPHAFSVRKVATIIELAQIVASNALEPDPGAIFSLTPNSFEVQLRDGTAQSFVVMGRDTWIETVERLRAEAV
ncbi:hypothetical protein IAD21_05153 [Abditibacteriota bacterium]|nr:hypothetical protein IAD21_05153 [Abditibacteriota bacterium]